jgi:hypothetical protein
MDASRYYNRQQQYNRLMHKDPKPVASESGTTKENSIAIKN